MYRPNKVTVTAVDVLAGKVLFKLDLFEEVSSLLGDAACIPSFIYS